MIGTMDRLKRWLRETKTTQKALGEMLSVKQPTVCDWVRGKNSPSIDNLMELSRITGLTTDELLGVQQPKNRSQHRPAA